MIRNVRLDIRLTVMGTEKPLLHATLIGSTPATDSVLSQMIYQWLSGAQGVMTGSTEVETSNDVIIGSEGILEPLESSGKRG